MGRTATQGNNEIAAILAQQAQAGLHVCYRRIRTGAVVDHRINAMLEQHIGHNGGNSNLAQHGVGNDQCLAAIHGLDLADGAGQAAAAQQVDGRHDEIVTRVLVAGAGTRFGQCRRLLRLGFAVVDDDVGEAGLVDGAGRQDVAGLHVEGAVGTEVLQVIRGDQFFGQNTCPS